MWTLILYIGIESYSASTGGPLVEAKYATYAQCEARAGALRAQINGRSTATDKAVLVQGAICVEGFN